MTKKDLIQRMSDIGWTVVNETILIFTRNFGGRKRGRSITITFSYSSDHIIIYHPSYSFIVRHHILKVFMKIEDYL